MAIGKLRAALYGAALGTAVIAAGLFVASRRRVPIIGPTGSGSLFTTAGDWFPDDVMVTTFGADPGEKPLPANTGPQFGTAGYIPLFGFLNYGGFSTIGAE